MAERKGGKKYESQRLADLRWQKNNTKSYVMKCFLKTDADIMQRMESLDNKSGYLKELIRNDIALSADPAVADRIASQADPAEYIRRLVLQDIAEHPAE